MANVEVKMHLRGVEEAFRADGVVDDERKRANQICDAANDKIDELYPDNGYKTPHFGVYEYSTTHGNIGFRVVPLTELAKRAQAEHNVLTEAIDAGRG